MTFEANTVGIIATTILSVGIFAGVVKWGVGKYFEKSNQLQELKEKSILSEVQKMQTSITKLQSEMLKQHEKSEKMKTSIDLIMRSINKLQDSYRLMAESNFENIQSINRTLEKINDFELYLAQHETRMKR